MQGCWDAAGDVAARASSDGARKVGLETQTGGFPPLPCSGRVPCPAGTGCPVPSCAFRAAREPGEGCADIGAQDD